MKLIAIRLTPSLLTAIVLCLASSHLCGQAQTLFFEDFESGGQGWTTSSTICGTPWHVSGDGECGAVSRMGAYTNPTVCDFNGTGCGEFTSPLFTLSGTPPFFLEFDYLKSMQGCCYNAIIEIVDPLEGVIGYLHNFVYVNGPDATTVQHWRRPLPGWASGRQVMLIFYATAGWTDATGFGWMIDNIRVKDSSRAIKGSSAPTGSGVTTVPILVLSPWPKPGGVLRLLIDQHGQGGGMQFVILRSGGRHLAVYEHAPSFEPWQLDIPLPNDPSLSGTAPRVCAGMSLGGTFDRSEIEIGIGEPEPAESLPR